ncbi:RNA polymerase sigma factor [Flavivirga spongiicola]|uniref:RNA polymerase sigma-70 factor n=1 Tax=Flavivirga spongiicola TaxID=421621 RepID=A0ABU7XYH1_9FLAO|nr:RNA polymerase sigma-70 factor [Flavivirga sp. MEBiC05379]MDO5980828.1 RNA polymerase sigma-70 factor [Flavivirga sp. MEBiC05379]
MITSLNSDKSLIDRLKIDDKKAFDYIYNVYYDKLCLYIFSFSSNDAIAEDIVQDILLKLWENRKNLNIHTSLKAYLYKSVYYTYIDHYRLKRKRNDQLETIRMNAINNIVEKDDEFIEQKLVELRAAIKELPPKGKEVFLLSKMQGYKYREIAETLNISINTVEVHMTKSLKFLRKRLIDKGNDFIKLFLSFYR